LGKLYTCDEIAVRYGVKTITVWDWIRKRRLPAMKIGKSYRISDDDIASFESASRKSGEQVEAKETA
jgi:excisionase family DNA binding protein